MDHSVRAYENLPLPEYPRSWAEIDLSALQQNYRLLCNRLQRRAKPIAVVKADAYGHGMAICAKALFGVGCRRFAVSCIEEGIALRRAIGKGAQILILGYTDPASIKQLSGFDLSQTILSPAYGKDLLRAARASDVCVRVQYALDTGMNRIGFLARNKAEIRQTAKDIRRFCKESAFRSEGLFTHFACADDPSDRLTDLQSERFSAVRDLLFKNGTVLPCHVCNSAGTLLRPQDQFDAVRLGIVLWGVLPTDQIQLQLRPVLRLCTRVVHLHRTKRGDRVGYGGEFHTSENRTVATLPIGYADGWLRAYRGATITVGTSKGTFRVPLIGRICMDQCMADVTGIGAKIGDRVVLFGEDPNDLSVLARRANTIPYESLSLISSRVPRIYQKQK